jgi:hypothetical protein
MIPALGSLCSCVALAALVAVAVAQPADGPAPQVREPQAGAVAGPGQDVPAPPKGEVKREGNRVWIEGVPALRWGTRKECTFCGALEAALAVTKSPVRYNDLMGVSGLAFRVRWYRGDVGDKHCPSSAAGEFPQEIAAIVKATGWPLRCEAHMGEPASVMAAYVPQIVASIDAGRPVLGYPDNMDMAVIYGYEDGGKTLLWRDYSAPATSKALAAEKLSGMLMFLGDRAPGLTPKEAFVEGLKLGVANWDREPMAGETGKYHYGGSGLTAWIEDLGAADTLDEEERAKLFMVNWWNFMALNDARAAASTFLRRGMRFAEGDAREALQQAQARYEEEAALLMRPFRTQDAFLGPWQKKKVADWTPEVRAREARVLEDARKLEAEAVGFMARALAAWKSDAASTADPAR